MTSKQQKRGLYDLSFCDPLGARNRFCETLSPSESD